MMWETWYWGGNNGYLTEMANIDSLLADNYKL